jgi:hypothetical protein
MTLPACFGSYAARRTDPCAACGLRGPCSSERAQAFAILHHPRYCPPVAQAEVDLPDSGDAYLAKVREALKAASWRTANGGWAKGRAGTVFQVVEAAKGRIVVEFPDVPPHRLASLPAADRADVYARCEQNDTAHELSVYGSRAVVDRISRMVALAQSVYTSIYSGASRD